MNATDRLLQLGLNQGAFGAADLLVARAGKIVVHKDAGSVVISKERLFDLASLTKPLATAVLFMQAAEQNRINPQDRIGKFFRNTHLKDIPLARLLDHTSGLCDWFDFAKPLLRRKTFKFDANRDTIVTSILRQKKFWNARAARAAQTIYSDLGYIVLGAVLEKVYQKPLDRLFAQKIAKPLGLANSLFYQRVGTLKNVARFVPAEICALRDRILQGEAMDENCWIMGGVSGHAGLFGDARAIHRLLAELRKAALGRKNKLGISQATFARFCAPDPARPLSLRSFTLGFDTPTQPGSQSGKKFSPLTIGHLGFAGTSFWWDFHRDAWIILLTNRCYPSRKNARLSQLRPQIHDALFGELKWS